MSVDGHHREIRQFGSVHGEKIAPLAQNPSLGFPRRAPHDENLVEGKTLASVPSAEKICDLKGNFETLHFPNFCSLARPHPPSNAIEQ